MNKKVKYWVVVSILLFFANTLFAVDPFLATTISRDLLMGPSGAPPTPTLIPVIVTLKPQNILNKINGENLMIKSCGKDYCSFWVTPNQAKELIKQFGNYVILSKKLRPMLNIAVPAVGGTAWHNGLETGWSVNGKGVLVGIIDTGIDPYHPDFKNPDGSTRIAFLWDQTLSGDPNHHPKGFDYGYECDALDINEMKCPSNDKGTLDNPSYGHGTHVAGIAAGNNSKYTGMAPDATLIVVKSLFDESSVVDAARYIINKAKELQMPVVINMSFGADYGPHDGTTWVERELGNLVGPGKIIVAAAGNQADITPHFSGKATSSTGWLEIIPSVNNLGEALGTNLNDVYLDIWSIANMKFKIAMVDSDTGEVVYQTTRNFSSSNCSCTGTSCNNLVCTEDISDDQGNKIASIGMSAGRNMVDNKIESVFILHPITKDFIDKYRWFLGFERDESYDVRFDAWVVNSSGWFSSGPQDKGSYYETFTEDGTPISYHIFYGDNWCTVTVPATSDKIIAVGSYVTRTSWMVTIDGKQYIIQSNDTPPVGNISNFSSRGGCQLNIFKPDITAPGEWIISSMSQNVNIDPQMVIDKYHDVMRGTSMASPMVAGGIALLLEYQEDLDFTSVRKLITQNAISDIFTGKVPNNIWGYGKFNLNGLSSYLTKEALNRDPLTIKDISIKKDPIYRDVTISWTTNRLADTYLEYKKEGGSTNSIGVMSYSTRHRVTLNNLAEGKYTFRISATSPYDETVKSQSLTFTFEKATTGCGCSAGDTASDPILIFLLLSFFLLRLKHGFKQR